MAEKYIFFFLSRSIAVDLATSVEPGALGAEPSAGMSAGVEMAGEYWAEPKMYGRNEWSSRPQTPWEPAGSSVYVRMSLRIRCKYLVQGLTLLKYEIEA